MTAPAAGLRLARPRGAIAPRRAWVRQLMGMPVSIHVRGPRPDADAVVAAVDRAFGVMAEVEARFSPFRDDSELCRVQREELGPEAWSTWMTEVDLLCRQALVRTRGAFDAWGWRAVDGRSVFDPTGLVKGWAIGRATRELDDLADHDVAVYAGGDIATRVCGPDSPDWVVGIEDPRARGRLLAHVPLRSGAVATSGSAARGAHIRRPGGAAAGGLASATVIGPSILWADVLATVAMVLGPDATAWTSELHGTSGLLVGEDGSVHRWANPW